MHEVLVNRLGGLSLPRNSVVRVTDRPDMTLAVYRGRKTTMQQLGGLTLKAPITTARDDIHKYFFHCFSEKIRLDVSSDSSVRQWIHMKNQALFSSKDKSKKLKCRLLLQFLFGACLNPRA